MSFKPGLKRPERKELQSRDNLTRNHTLYLIAHFFTLSETIRESNKRSSENVGPRNLSLHYIEMIGRVPVYLSIPTATNF